MSSTGEVGCLGDDLNEALLNALIATGYRLPNQGASILISSGDAKGKVSLLEPAKCLVQKGYKVYATGGTAKFFNDNGIAATAVSWPDEEGENNVMDMIAQHQFDLIVNVPKNHTKREPDQWLPHPSRSHRPQHTADDQRTSGQGIYRSLYCPQAGRHQDQVLAGVQQLIIEQKEQHTMTVLLLLLLVRIAPTYLLHSFYFSERNGFEQ